MASTHLARSHRLPSSSAECAHWAQWAADTASPQIHLRATCSCCTVCFHSFSLSLLSFEHSFHGSPNICPIFLRKVACHGIFTLCNRDKLLNRGDVLKCTAAYTRTNTILQPHSTQAQRPVLGFPQLPIKIATIFR